MEGGGALRMEELSAIIWETNRSPFLQLIIECGLSLLPRDSNKSNKWEKKIERAEEESREERLTETHLDFSSRLSKQKKFAQSLRNDRGYIIN